VARSEKAAFGGRTMIKGINKKWIFSFLAVLVFCFTGLAQPQSQEKQEKKVPEKKKDAPAPEVKEKYKKWLSEEVIYIVSEN
jgi:hypothetical protein